MVCKYSLFFLKIVCVTDIPLWSVTLLWNKLCFVIHITGVFSSWPILYMRPANERRRYIVTSSLIGWAHTQNDHWCPLILAHPCKSICMQRTHDSTTVIIHIWRRSFLLKDIYAGWRNDNETFYALLSNYDGNYPMIPFAKGQYAQLQFVILFSVSTNSWTNIRVAGDLRRFDVIVMFLTWRVWTLSVARMMTTWHWNTFRITVPLCGESSEYRWLYSTKGQ